MFNIAKMDRYIFVIRCFGQVNSLQPSSLTLLHIPSKFRDPALWNSTVRPKNLNWKVVIISRI